MKQITNQKDSSNPLLQAFSNWGFSWGGFIDNRKGEWWLVGQISFIAAHFLPPWPSLKTLEVMWPLPIVLCGACLFLLGTILIAEAFLQIGASLSPLPDPKPGAALVTRGPYRRCRHPLYQALLISSVGVVITFGSITHFLLLLGLCTLLIGKAKREEKKLLLVHSEYFSYMLKTPAIFPKIPFLDWRT